MQERISPLRSKHQNAASMMFPPELNLDRKPFVSLIAPAFNEALILQDNLSLLCDYLRSLESDYDWEIVIVNDGSHDETGWLAQEFAQTRPNVRVLHHRVNRGLGHALRTGFSGAQGDYIVVVDLDLSYSPEHIGLLLRKIQDTQAGVVVASPYMTGGCVSNVPWLRRELSVWANRFLSIAAKRNLATLTGMVRVYDAEFLRSLNLRSSGMEINPEVIHKAFLLRTRVEEVPAHLNWKTQESQPKKRQRRSSLSSSAKLMRHTWDIFFSGFLIRPVMFFIVPSLLFFVLSLYANVWVLIHCWTNYQFLAHQTPFPDATEAVALAFRQAPHAFFIGGTTLVLAIQLFSLGVVSVQNKSYFEELFYLGTAIYKRKHDRED